MQATDMRSLSRDARHERRVQVIRLRERGYSYEDIAHQTGLSRTGVFDICKRWRLLGETGLYDAPGGRPAGEGRPIHASGPSGPAAIGRPLSRYVSHPVTDRHDLRITAWNDGAIRDCARRVRAADRFRRDGGFENWRRGRCDRSRCDDRCGRPSFDARVRGLCSSP